MFQDVKVDKKTELVKKVLGFHLPWQHWMADELESLHKRWALHQAHNELALKYAKERKAFGKQLTEHQAIQFKLADMATKIDAARLLIWQAASLKDQKKDFVKAAAMAKLYASQIAQEVTTEAVQIHGGYGYVKEFPCRAPDARCQDHVDLWRHFWDSKDGDLKRVDKG